MIHTYFNMECDNFHFDQPQGVFRTTPCVQNCGAKLSGILSTNVKGKIRFLSYMISNQGKSINFPLVDITGSQ